MATKTVTITEDAYEAIRHLKHEGESFSELFLRMAETKIRVKDIVGILKHTPEEAKAFKEGVHAMRQRLDEGIIRRITNVRSRFKRVY